MMKKIFSVSSLLIMLLLTSFKHHDWKEYTPEHGKCAVLMPGQPTIEEKIVHTELGEIKLNIFMYQPARNSDDNLIYSMSYADYPEGSSIHSDSTEILKDFFNKSRDGAIANIQGKLLSETSESIQGYPGREQRIAVKNGLAIVRFRSFLVKNRFYNLQVITPAANNFNKSINRFMNSFKLLE